MLFVPICQIDNSRVKCFSKVKMSQNWEEICRLCASHSELNPTSQELSQIILKHLSIVIKNSDGFSTKVCHKCEEKVMDFHNFSKECERIQSMFIDYKNVDTLPDQDFVALPDRELDFESFGNVKIKEELNYDETERYEDCKEFAEAIEVKNTNEVRVENKGKSIRVKKMEKIYALKYECHICKLECRNWGALSSHIKSEHKTKPQVKCLCNKILYTYRTTWKHERKHNPNKHFRCHSCSKIFPTKYQLASHEYTHVPKAERPCVCSKCFRRYSNPSTLALHEKKAHTPRPERPKLPCELCDKKLVSKLSLELHMKTVHEKLKPFMCDLCGLTFGLKESLTKHKDTHISERNFTCDICNAKFKSKRILQGHMESHSNKVYQCPHCPMLLKTRITLRLHLHVHKENKDVICTVCGRGYKTKNNLKFHMKTHKGELRYKCRWCPQMFSDKSSYDLHKKTEHPTEFQMESTYNRYAPVKGDNGDAPKKIIRTTLKSNRIHLLQNPATQME